MDYCPTTVVTKADLMAMNYCPECGAIGCLSHEGGCAVCMNCGWSPCK